jgi:hypothetical protein
MAALRKHKLEYAERFDFLLLGMSSTENDYRLIWQINKQLGFEFIKTDNHKIKAKGSLPELEFSHYIFEHEDLYLVFRIISNKSPDGVLMEELKNIDFLLIVQGKIEDANINELVSGLKSIEHIQAVFRIDPSGLKSRERLLV